MWCDISYLASGGADVFQIQAINTIPSNRTETTIIKKKTLWIHNI